MGAIVLLITLNSIGTYQHDSGRLRRDANGRFYEEAVSLWDWHTSAWNWHTAIVQGCDYFSRYFRRLFCGWKTKAMKLQMSQVYYCHVLRWPFKITGLIKFLGGLVILAALSPTVQAESVTLAWNPSTDPIVAGYNVYYGGTSGNYTNMVSAGSATNATISGLIPGTTYYFAATTYGAAGMESPFSSEMPYTVPTPPAGVQFRVTPARQFVLTVTGPISHTYDILATQDFTTWTVIGTVTIGASGSLDLTDTNAADFPQRFYRIQETP